MDHNGMQRRVLQHRTSPLLGKFRNSLKGIFANHSGHRRRPSVRLNFEPLEDRRLFAAQFFAPAQPSGGITVQLLPLANVAAGTEEIVTFGMPFTRGSVSQSQLSQVRVLKNGVEIPAFVAQLAPWRSIDDPSVDGQSVRVARIQIAYSFATPNPEAITVQWGGPTRTLNRGTMQDPRLEWHTVASGTFMAADNVEEPDVLPLLPKEYLSQGMLDARTDPISSSVDESRDDPTVMDSMSFTGYTEYDHAQKNFFYTTINQNPGITIDYKTQSEPWLYDRSSAMYALYLRSGFATALREAIRSADFYADHLNGSGYFTLRPGDPKYAYNEPLAYTYWLLGDNRMLAPISTVVNAHNGTVSRWNPNLNFWTERNVGYKLLASEVAYEVTGNSTFKTNVQTIVTDLIWHQNGADGQLPTDRVDGGLYHTGQQHDASEVGDPNVIIASSWMSALVADPMVRAYGIWQNPQIADFIVRLGNFEKAASKTDADGQFDGTSRYPDYLMRADGTSENRSETDVQHAMDVGAVAAWGTYFAELRGMPDASLRQLADDLYATYEIGVNYWTRPGGTNFNVSPPRRYTWEYKNSSSFSWALTGSDEPGPAGALQFSAASYIANEHHGSIAITVTRTGGSTGAVNVNYTTTNGSANTGDYTPTSGTLTFQANETARTFAVPITNDTGVEANETVNLTLSNPSGGATLGSPITATITILDNDLPTGRFNNVTDSSGVESIIAQKYQESPSWWLSGQHLIDLDNDGDLDLYLSNHGGGSVVALNNGGGVFSRITNGSFPDSEIHQMYDINEDGKVDVSMTYQDGGGRWWINNSTQDAVNFTATNVTRGGNTARSKVMMDFNSDGKVDWLRSAPPGLVVDFGNGAGNFTAGSLTFNVPDTTSNNNASYLPADFDNDDDIDLLVLTGGGYDGTLGKTSYWRNNGNLTFTHIIVGTGIPTDGTIAKGSGDYDHDGDTDFIAVENKAMPPVIYLNNGQGEFTKKAGAISGVTPGTMEYSAWGTAISTDFDNDGIVDIIMNGKYYLKVLRGTGGGNFTSMNTAWNIRDTAASAVDDGLCFGDIDSDGDLDIIGYNEIWPTRTINVYRNDVATNHWLNVRPVGLAGNKGAAGAKISIYAAGTNELLWYEQVATYDFQVATSYYGHSEAERHFGLGSRETVDVEVEFPGTGQITLVNNVAANQTIRVHELQSNPPVLPGDYNQNGEVDAADYVVWRRMRGSNVAQPYSGADGDGDGVVDSDDYSVWKSHFGMIVPTSMAGTEGPVTTERPLQIGESHFAHVTEAARVDTAATTIRTERWEALETQETSVAGDRSVVRAQHPTSSMLDEDDLLLLALDRVEQCAEPHTSAPVNCSNGFPIHPVENRSLADIARIMSAY
jgi:hypothetical protein